MKKLTGYYSDYDKNSSISIEYWHTSNEKRAVDRGLCVWGGHDGKNFSVVIPWTELQNFVDIHRKKGTFRRGR